MMKQMVNALGKAAIGILGIALPFFLSSAPAIAAGLLVTDPGPVAALVTMDEAVLKRFDATTVDMGEVELTSGRIVATDPLVQPERPPFLVTVPPGRYPVTLFKSEGRIAAASMRFAPGTPVRWQLAVIKGQDIKTLKADEFFGYGVDTGLGSYMDADTIEAIREREKKVEIEKGSKDFNYYDDVLAHELSTNGDDFALHQPIALKPNNVAVFSSGWGDGFYPVYWGLDEKGTPLVILTDFQVIERDPAKQEGQP